MKIYTKTGDKGQTSLIGGKRVAKYHDRIEAYGTVDELISYIGLIRDQNIDNTYKTLLIHVQNNLMTCAAILATDCDDCQVKLPEFNESSIAELEQAIDSMDSKLPPLTSFILPGGHTVVSFCHIARTVCRRAERQSLKLASQTFVPEQVLKYLNRLSDYLFVLSRSLSADFEAVEIYWNTKL